jgi:hypothetical protein
MPLPSLVPPALLCDGTKEELRMALQRRGTIGFQQGHSVSKDVLKVMLNMSIENEELKQELALAQKRSACLAAHSTPSKRAAACASGTSGNADESPSSGSADVSHDMHAAASDLMTCSACLYDAHRCYTHWHHLLTSLQASMAPKHPRFSVAVARAPSAASASCTAAAPIAKTW